MIVGRLPAYRHRTKLVQEALFDDRVVAIAGKQHPLARKKSVSFSQIAPFGWILPPLETTLRRQIDQFFISKDQYVPPFIIESVSYLTNRSLFQSRDLIGLMPDHVVSHDIENGLLVEIDWQVPFGKGPVGVSFRGPDSLSPASTAFLAALRQAANRYQEN
jgi:DNA-binding transcriptional LysR family regulator